MKILGLLVVLFIWSNPLSAMADELFAKPNETVCQSVELSVQATNGIDSWSYCESESGDFYLLEGATSDGQILAAFSFSSFLNKTELQVEYFGEAGRISVELGQDALIMRSSYRADKTLEDDQATNAEVALASSACEDLSLRPVESASWGTGLMPSKHGAAVEDTIQFFSSRSNFLVSDLLNRFVNDLGRGKGLAEIKLPDEVSRARLGDRFEPTSLAFYMLDAGTARQAGTKAAYNCALLALGATGALVSTLDANPSLAIPCGGACGMVYFCAVTLAGGGKLTQTCAVAIGSCMSCVGMGYSRSLGNCLRVFQSVY
jgi:hypothetical protein